MHRVVNGKKRGSHRCGPQTITDLRRRTDDQHRHPRCHHRTRRLQKACDHQPRERSPKRTRRTNDLGRCVISSMGMVPPKAPRAVLTYPGGLSRKQLQAIEDVAYWGRVLQRHRFPAWLRAIRRRFRVLEICWPRSAPAPPTAPPNMEAIRVTEHPTVREPCEIIYR